VKLKLRNKRIVGAALLVVAGIALWPLVRPSSTPLYLAEADLGEGRIIRVEGVSFGKTHAIGNESLVVRMLGPWLPYKVTEMFEPAVPKNRIDRDTESLVVWVNAVDAVTRTNVDCQGIKLDFMDANGARYGDDQPNWFGGTRFWRVGHAFNAFPRGTKDLTLNITSWRNSNSARIMLPNPGFTAPRPWRGKAAPQREVQGDYELVLRKLNVVTNPGTYWKSAIAYWHPEMEIWRGGEKQESGWEFEFMAEDRYGNRGEQLGLTEPVLKFTVTFHPSATNFDAAVLWKTLPAVTLGATEKILWNLPATFTTNHATILGFFPAGVHEFGEEGEYLSNSPSRFGPVRGGAKSGWVSQSKRETPTRTRRWYGHYSDVPIIYVRLSNPNNGQRMAMRLVDEQKQVFLAEAEPQGAANGVLPFLIRTPPGGATVRPELVLLPAVKADFLIETAAEGNR